MAVQVGDEIRAYSLEVEAKTVIQEEIGGTDVVVFVDPKSGSGSAFVSTIDDHPLTFEVQDDRFADVETGTIWNLSGISVQGSLEGEELTPLPSKTMFWFALVATEPGVTLYQPDF